MSQEKQSFLKIALGCLKSRKPISFSIYVRINHKHTLYLRAGEILSDEKLAQLLARDLHGNFFYVSAAEWPLYKAFIFEQINSNELTLTEKVKVLHSSSMALVEELFENPDVNVALDSSRPVIENFVAFIEAEPKSMSHLLALSGHDFYTYNHSLDVSIYALGLGKALGMTIKELEELGMSALFHDIGKRNVSLDILCKKGTLSNEEWHIMQQHPHYGIKILNENQSVTDAMKAACFEHHESYQGNGYPQQLIGNEIHPYARIVAITDTYDALTTQRSYNVPMFPMDAVGMMKEKLQGRYDPDMIKALHSIMFQLKKSAA